MKKVNRTFYYLAFANLTFFLGNAIYISFPVFLKNLGASESMIGVLNNVDKILIIITSLAIASFVRVKNKILLLRAGYFILILAFLSYMLIDSLTWLILLIRIFPDGALALLIDRAFNWEAGTGNLVRRRAADHAFLGDSELHEHVVVWHTVARHSKHTQRQPFDLLSLFHGPVGRSLGDRGSRVIIYGRRLIPESVHIHDVVVAIDVLARAVVPVVRSAPAVVKPGR